MGGRSTGCSGERAGEIADRLVGSLMRAMGIPGASAAASVDGRVAWSISRGVADLDSGAPVHAGTIFRLGSISKSMTGTLAARLAQDGEIDLDRPVLDHLEHVPDRYATLTLREILTFTSGIPAYATLEEQCSAVHYERARDVLPLFINRPLGHEPGEGYLYSSYAYVFAAVVLEAATGLEFPELMRRYVLGPLGMGETILEDPTRRDGRCATWYERSPGGEVVPARRVDFFARAAASGYASTASDLLRLGESLLGPGFLTEPLLAELARRPPAGERAGSPWGLGWRQLPDRKRRRVMFGGGQTVGCNACVLIYPDQRAALSFVSNLGGYPMARTGLQPIVECLLAERGGTLGEFPAGLEGRWRLADGVTGEAAGELDLDAGAGGVRGECVIAGLPRLRVSDGYAIAEEAYVVSTRADVGVQALSIAREGERTLLTVVGLGRSLVMERAAR